MFNFCQLPIQSRRRNLEVVLALQRILDIQERAYGTTHSLTIVEPYTVGLVDRQAQESALTAQTNLQVRQLLSQPFDSRLEQFLKLISGHCELT